MSVLKRADIAPPTPLGRETVPVPELGGEVVVRGMTLTERLVVTATEGKVEQYEGIAFALSRCVLAEGDKPDEGLVPLMTQDEWEAWGTDHVEAAIALFVVVKRLSLLERSDVEKKSSSTPS